MKRLSIIILFASLSYGLNAFQLGTMKILSSKAEPFKAIISVEDINVSDVANLKLENFEGGFAKRKNLIDTSELKIKILTDDKEKVISISSNVPLDSDYFDFLLKLDLKGNSYSRRYFGVVPLKIIQKKVNFTEPKKKNSESSDQFIVQDLGSCLEIQNAQQRLICFDKSLGVRNNSELPKAKKTSVSQEQVTEEYFGKSRKDLEEAIERRQNFEIPERLSSTITKVKRYNTDRYLITLSNGQIWRLLEPSPRQLFKKNKEIRIEKGLLGSFQISVEGNNRKYKAKREK